MAATEQWSQRAYARGESAERVFWVDASDEEAATRASGVPSQNSSHPLDIRLLAQVPSVRPITLGVLYEVRIRYVRLRTGGQEEENPLDQDPMIDWRIGSTTEPVDADPDGNPLVNSVGDLFEGLTEEFPTLFLTYTRWESSYDVQKAIAYGNKTNSDGFTIAGPNGPMIVNPGQALCLSITTEPHTVGAEAVPVSYNFEFREDGFKRRLIDQGLNGIYDSDGEKKIAQFVDGDGKFATQPVRLKNGKPIKQGEVEFKVGAGKKEPVAGRKPDGAEVEGDENVDFLIFKRKKEIAFSGLNL